MFETLEILETLETKNMKKDKTEYRDIKKELHNNKHEEI